MHPTIPDVAVEVVFGDPDVPAELEEGDASLEDQPADEPGLVLSRSAASWTVSSRPSSLSLARSGGTGPHLLPGDAAALAGVLGHGPREPGVSGGAIPAARVLPACHRDHPGGREQPAVLVQRNGRAVQAACGPGATRGPQRLEAGRVAAALGDGVATEAEQVRAAAQPKARQLGLAA